MASMANAVIVNVVVGDRPYYSRGPGYYVGHVYWVWMPGHLGLASPSQSLGSTAITHRAKRPLSLPLE